MADQFLDAAEGPVGEELSRGPTADAVETELGPNNSVRSDGRSSVVSVGTEGRIAERHPGMDVLLYHILDVVCPFRGSFLM